MRKTAYDQGAGGQGYRFSIQRSWRPTICLLEIKPPSSPAAMGISACGFSLRPGSWQINCSKTPLLADAPRVQLHPAPGRDSVDEPLQMGESKEPPNNFATPVITLEGFCCALQGQTPGNTALEELNAMLDSVIQELLHHSRCPSLLVPCSL